MIVLFLSILLISDASSNLVLQLENISTSSGTVSITRRIGSLNES